MLDPGIYYVITLGRRFVRYPEHGIVGAQVDHAAKFDTEDEAVAAALDVRRQARLARSKHKVGVLRITVESVPLPAEGDT